ncbi:hypothetical protein BAE44_0002433 [Dichanthelium oligosanthes]|uniref:VQ domain-containing protein n=1 Tax=Dichanthelium oligosanthes TaxID=888268 RepID=A0A1E5WGL8_9POAL|nr:hypothetical protein BAE44_0002433 [Dichanthelium oligosanthes]
MASTASDSNPSSPAAAPASAFLDDHPLFLDPATSSFFPATSSREPLPPAPASVASRKPPRKRPRASRRPPTTVFTTDTSNFRAMVQEFTGIPAPPPFAPHLGPGVLFGAPHDPAAAGSRAPLELLMRPSPLKLPAAPHVSPPTGSLFAHSLFANSNANNPAGSSSESYSGFAPTTLSDAVPPYDGGFQAAEDERVGHGHGLFSSFLHAGDSSCAAGTDGAITLYLRVILPSREHS